MGLLFDLPPDSEVRSAGEGLAPVTETTQCSLLPEGETRVPVSEFNPSATLPRALSGPSLVRSLPHLLRRSRVPNPTDTGARTPGPVEFSPEPMNWLDVLPLGSKHCFVRRDTFPPGYRRQSLSLRSGPPSPRDGLILDGDTWGSRRLLGFAPTTDHWSDVPL